MLKASSTVLLLAALSINACGENQSTSTNKPKTGPALGSDDATLLVDTTFQTESVLCGALQLELPRTLVDPDPVYGGVWGYADLGVTKNLEFRLELNGVWYHPYSFSANLTVIGSDGIAVRVTDTEMVEVIYPSTYWAIRPQAQYPIHFATPRGLAISSETFGAWIQGQLYLNIYSELLPEGKISQLIRNPATCQDNHIVLSEYWDF